MAQLNRKLSKREWDVTELVLQGKTNKAIAAALSISERTVEFHLKNVYGKCQVNTRIELLVKLGNTPGKTNIEKLVESTVADAGKNAENGDSRNPQMGWGIPFTSAVSIIGKELNMKDLLATKHVLVGTMTAIFTGLLWVALFRYFTHMQLEEIRAWIAPLILVWALIGLALGVFGKRLESSLARVSLSTLFATGLSPIAILPIAGFIVYPLGKLITWLGLIDRAAIPTDVTTIFMIVTMLAIWLVLGIIFGSILLSVTLKKPFVRLADLLAPEHS